MVSIIVPIYNVDPFLNQCIDSILAQTYTDIEVLLIDDGSTDRCGEICNSYKDPRIIVFHTENHGLSAARNLGIENSHGEYLYFLDSDDWIDENLIEQAVDSIGDASIVCFSKNEGIYCGFDALQAQINRDIPDAVWSMMYRKDCFDTMRFPEGRIHEDTAITYKLLHDADKVICVDIHGHHYRFREDSLSHKCTLANIIDYWLSHKERYDYCKQYVKGQTRINLLRSCAGAIVNAWVWKNELETSDSAEWARMTNFVKTEMPFSIRRHFPLWLQGALILSMVNHPISFWVANKSYLITSRLHRRFIAFRPKKQ